MLGGTQSLHTNGFDEALGLPTEEAARIALRTQQIVGHETGVANTVDPLAGSYYIESLTNEIERRAQLYLDKIEALGGTLRGSGKGCAPPSPSPKGCAAWARPTRRAISSRPTARNTATPW